ncbi:hypothetical protein Dimus_020031 [Dionaea muscipula]
MGFMKSPNNHLISSMIKKTTKDNSPCYVRLQFSDHDDDESPRRQHCHHEVRKGYVPVMVGDYEGVREKFMVRTQYMTQPSIVALLELSADEFGYQHQGMLQISCDPDTFREIINSLSHKKRRSMIN